MTRAARQALVIGVSRFGQPPADDKESELGARDPLPYVAELTPKLADALGRLGYAGILVTDPEDTTADRIGRRIRGMQGEPLDPSGVRVVCVLSHGEAPLKTDGLMIVGSDDRAGDTNVSTWLGDVENLPERHPTTLFLLDVCHAGVAARLPWQLTHADGSSRAWVIAAAQAPRKAYDGRFTRALIQVLTEITDGAWDINPTVEFIQFDTVAKAVARRVIDLSAGKSQQRVTASVLDQSVSVDLPFFPNPHHRADTARDGVDDSLAKFPDELDPGMDPVHFTSRAAGIGPPPGLRPRNGHFHGRASQRRALTRWMNSPDDTDTVRLLTGAPGTGKSALLGVLVCAAHPTLRSRTEHLWERLQPNIPSRNPNLVAVHARERTITAIAGSLIRQLKSAPADRPNINGSDVDATRTMTVLLDALHNRPEPALVVVDALDEAVNAARVVRELLLPLIRARRYDGRPAVRLLVAGRTGPHWPRLDHLLAVTTIDQVIDLDNTPHDVLRDDLIDCITDVLAAQEPYDQPHFADIRSRIADEVADRMVTTQPDGARWGEFLVAGLFSHHLLTLPAPVSTSGQVDRLLADVPTTLPAVLELDLGGRPHDDLARPLLTGLAHAKGEGIALDLFAILFPVFIPTGNPVTTDAIISALAANRFYLRFGTDTDGKTLYRLFHQGLADHLLESQTSGYRQETASAILDRLLSTVRVTNNRRRWDLADPYLLRNILHHAQDAGRVGELLTDIDLLVYATPNALLSVLRDRDDPDSRLLAAVYRTAYPPGQRLTTRARRSLLTLEAARFRMGWNGDWCTDLSDQPDTGWRPIWATRSNTWAPDLGSETLVVSGHSDAVTAVSCTVLDGRPVAVTASRDRTARVWDLGTGAPVGQPLVGHSAAVTAVSCTVLDGRPVAVTGAYDKAVRVWDLGSGTPVGEPLVGHSAAVTAVSCTVLDGRPVAVTASRDRTARVWDLGTGAAVGQPLVGHTGWVTAVSCTVLDGRPVAVTASWDQTLRFWGLDTRIPLGTSMELPKPSQGLRALLDGRLLIGFGWDIALVRLPLSPPERR